jgi:hypothetical protein
VNEIVQRRGCAACLAPACTGAGLVVEQPSRATIYHNRAAWDTGVPGDAQGTGHHNHVLCPSGWGVCRHLARLLHPERKRYR